MPAVEPKELPLIFQKHFFNQALYL
jgi:hypothetical protein